MEIKKKKKIKNTDIPIEITGNVLISSGNNEEVRRKPVVRSFRTNLRANGEAKMSRCCRNQESISYVIKNRRSEFNKAW